MFEILASIDFWKFAAPLFGAIIAWFVNERRKREWEQYQRKEESYKELLRCLKGFYVGAEQRNEFIGEFLNQVNRCRLYCPDDVILNGYTILNTVHASNSSTDVEKEKEMGDFVASIRNDLLSRKLVRSTKLCGKDFKHLNTN
jgi:hypothetical protein